jgi:hypothetical protein
MNCDIIEVKMFLKKDGQTEQEQTQQKEDSTIQDSNEANIAEMHKARLDKLNKTLTLSNVNKTPIVSNVKQTSNLNLGNNIVEENNMMNLQLERIKAYKDKQLKNKK